MKETSNQIYEQLKDQIRTVVTELSKLNDESSVSEDISNAKKNLEQLNNRLQDELDKLKLNSEWNRFTIAFYGETNAGKSTLIEALRLQLGERTKRENQQKFKKIQKKFGLTQEAFDDIRKKIMDTEKAIELVCSELDVISNKYNESIIQAELNLHKTEDTANQEIIALELQHHKIISEFDAEILILNELLYKYISELNLRQRIIHYFIKSEEKKKLLEKKNELIKVKKQQKSQKIKLLAHHQILKKNKEQLIAEIKNKKELEQLPVMEKKENLQKYLHKFELEKQHLDKEANQLSKFADGQIIGDGRSDFTRENTSFDFDLDGQQFSLIDVPGIEGEETVVSKSIEDAVRKAHAVFYVTRTARPPQTSDGDASGTKGTLEKIKEHLGTQSEVWSIYNHPANNPRQLTSPLLNEDIKNSLMAMDEKLKIELEEQYCGSLVISARAAYLALTECIVPGSKVATEKRKFLESFGNLQTILSLSGLTDFIVRLQTTIIGDYRNKIKRSNLNKAYKAIEATINELQKLQNEFYNLSKNIKNEVSNTKSKINTTLEEFNGDLNAVSSQLRRNFRNDVEEKIYAEIEEDISNDSFKNKLEKKLEGGVENLKNDFKKKIENTARDLGESIKTIINRSNQHLENILTQHKNNFNLESDFSIDVNIDNGIKVAGLISNGIGGAIGIALLASNPIGWTVAFVGGALALLSSLIGLGKSIIGRFNSKYKKSQQRKETNKILCKMNDDIEEKMNKIINTIKEEVSLEIEKVMSELDTPVKQCATINDVFKKANIELTNISRNIKY